MQIAAVDTLTAAQVVGLPEPTSYRVVPLTRALTASQITRRLIDRIADEPAVEAPSPAVEEPKAPVTAGRPRVLFGGLRRVA